jgi:hypothetical protein
MHSRHDEPPHLCEACRERRARFRYRGRVKADRAHTLCFQCHRSVRDRAVAALLAWPEAWLPFVGLPVRVGRGLPVPPERVAGTPDDLRLQKYAALALRRRRAQIEARHALDAANVVAFRSRTAG